MLLRVFKRGFYIVFAIVKKKANAYEKIIQDIAQVFFASLFIGSFVYEIGFTKAAWGLVLSIIFWIMSIIISKS